MLKTEIKRIHKKSRETYGRPRMVLALQNLGHECGKERVARLMREEGLPHVYQLEGGILKYFELTDGAHYHGGCFVFDERRVLDTGLAIDTPTAAAAATEGAIK